MGTIATEDQIDFESEVGTAKDNLTNPIHDWYKFTAGFSYKFVNHIVEKENIECNKRIYDPFAGCGTTLVSAQKLGIHACGNEGQEFMHNIISTKLEWDCTSESINRILGEIESFAAENNNINSSQISHTLLTTLYEEDILLMLYRIKYAIELISDEMYRNFFKLALSQTLHKVCLFPIAVPYISRNKQLKRKEGLNPCWRVFSSFVKKMDNDLAPFRGIFKTSSVFLHDSRNYNKNIEDASCDICITSPPYLNNLDYGESSKVHTHFYGITDNWSDITNKVRKQLVTASTTHYSDKDFHLEDWMISEKDNICIDLLMRISSISLAIKKAAQLRDTKKTKSFDALLCYYFSDMLKVLIEARRVLKTGAKAYIILGDSAPYGELVPTTEILGELSLGCGFSKYSIQKIRDRGSKWKTLTHRHKIEVAENLLILE